MKIPQIKEESTGQYNIDNYIHAKEYVITPKRNKKYETKTEEQEWKELIIDIRKKIEENSKPTIGKNCNIETQSQDFVYDFREVKPVLDIKKRNYQSTNPAFTCLKCCNLVLAQLIFNS